MKLWRLNLFIFVSVRKIAQSRILTYKNKISECEKYLTTSLTCCSWFVKQQHDTLLYTQRAPRKYEHRYVRFYQKRPCNLCPVNRSSDDKLCVKCSRPPDRRKQGLRTDDKRMSLCHVRKPYHNRSSLFTLIIRDHNVWIE